MSYSIDPFTGRVISAGDLFSRAAVDWILAFAAENNLSVDLSGQEKAVPTPAQAYVAPDVLVGLLSVPTDGDLILFGAGVPYQISFSDDVDSSGVVSIAARSLSQIAAAIASDLMASGNFTASAAGPTVHITGALPNSDFLPLAVNPDAPEDFSVTISGAGAAFARNASIDTIVSNEETCTVMEYVNRSFGAKESVTYSS